MIPKNVGLLAFLLIERMVIEGPELYPGGWQFPNLGDHENLQGN